MVVKVGNFRAVHTRGLDVKIWTTGAHVIRQSIQGVKIPNPS